MVKFERLHFYAMNKAGVIFLIHFTLKELFMQSSPIWISLSQDNKNSSMLLKVKQLLQNKEEIKNLLKASPCKAKCTGSCGSLK